MIDYQTLTLKDMTAAAVGGTQASFLLPPPLWPRGFLPPDDFRIEEEEFERWLAKDFRAIVAAI